nr:MAG TPA: hypothetical protein [Caudoviricetes sp.]
MHPAIEALCTKEHIGTSESTRHGVLLCNTC